MTGALLEIRGLNVSFQAAGGALRRALRGVDFDLAAGETHALVGESGSGKTVASLAVMGLLPAPAARVEGGCVRFRGRELLDLPAEARRRLRGREIAMVFQEPGKYLNPAFTIGEQIVETLVMHLPLDRRAAAARAMELLAKVGLEGTRRRMKTFPHELSGGMKQRAMIAMAVACRPALLIADEPTTALDVTLQLQIVRLLRELQAEFSMGIVFISHDLRVVGEIADRVSVIYAGRIVETGGREALFRDPRHPYTRLLLESIPQASRRGRRLTAIPGLVPDAERIPAGCSFHPRCPLAQALCREAEPAAVDAGGGRRAACHFIGKPWTPSSTSAG